MSQSSVVPPVRWPTIAVGCIKSRIGENNTGNLLKFRIADMNSSDYNFPLLCRKYAHPFTGGFSLIITSYILNCRQVCIINQRLKEIDVAQMEIEKDSKNDVVPTIHSTPLLESQKSLPYPSIDRTHLVTLHELCNRIIVDLDSRNFAVIDSFLEESLLYQVFDEVQKLYCEEKVFQPGQFSHMTGMPMQANKEVRGDLVTWIDNSTHPKMKHLMLAVRRTDEMVALLSSDQKLIGCNIRSRSSVMVACYPGKATRYKRHIDNPLGDGRKLTTILYLNKNYLASRDGGALRIYRPDGSGHYEIDPLFGRLIVFWSDYRTPHEVLPCYRERFAISVWYFDTKERNESLKSAAMAMHAQDDNH